jgi:hypothetical protein
MARNYPKKRIVDAPDPEVMFGQWQVRQPPGEHILIRERSIYIEQNGFDSVAREKRIDFESTDTYTEFCLLTPAGLRRMKQLADRHIG